MTCQVANLNFYFVNLLSFYKLFSDKTIRLGKVETFCDSIQRMFVKCSQGDLIPIDLIPIDLIPID